MHSEHPRSMKKVYTQEKSPKTSISETFVTKENVMPSFWTEYLDELCERYCSCSAC